MMEHTCSYYCERPECIRAQRDELRDRLEKVDHGGAVAWRITDGEGSYIYSNEPPSEFDIQWSAKYGRKHESLYTHPQDPALAERLLREVMASHSDPDSSEYNLCDKSPCQWCEDAKAALGGGR